MDCAQALVEAIRQSRILVLVFSARSNHSPHVRREVERAVSRDIPILPFRIEDVPPSPSLEYFISNAHWLDALTPPLERHLEHLAEAVKLLLAGVTKPEQVAAEAKGPKSAEGAGTRVRQRQHKPTPLRVAYEAGKRWGARPVAWAAVSGALAAAILLGVLVTLSCGGGEGDADGGVQPPASTIPPSTGSPAGTPAPTLEPRPTLTPGAYEPPAGSANLFGNSGFEQGTDYWFSLRPEQPDETSDIAHSGQASAYLKMRDPTDATGAQVYYLVQEIAPAEFPELVSGYYRVENWKRGTEKQYLQFVVIVFAPTNLTVDKEGAPLSTPFPNYQIRYPLAGISEEPFLILNAFFKFLGREDPRQGEWVYFETNIKEDFLEKWKAVPEGYSKIRVLFEVRYDDKEAGLPSEADVYYDDLYMGPADANPNKP